MMTAFLHDLEAAVARYATVAAALMDDEAATDLRVYVDFLSDEELVMEYRDITRNSLSVTHNNPKWKRDNVKTTEDWMSYYSWAR